MQDHSPKCSISLLCCHFDYNIIQPAQGLKRTTSTNYFHGQKNKHRFNRQRRSLKHRLNSEISGIENNLNNYSNQSSEFKLRVSEYSSQLDMVTPDRNSFIHPLDRTLLDQKNSMKKISLNELNLHNLKKKPAGPNKNCIPEGRQIATIHQPYFSQNYHMRNSALKKSSQLVRSSLNKRNAGNIEQSKKVIFEPENMQNPISNPQHKLKH